MVLPFYKNMLSKPLTFSHLNLTLLFYSKSFILKFSHKFNLGNTLFVSKSINNMLSSLFSETFLFSSGQYNYEKSWSSLGNLHEPFYKTNIYGKNSINAINALSQTFISDIYLLKKSVILSDSTFRVFKLMLDFSNFISTISILTFSLYLLLLFYYIHFTIWSSFDILN